MMRQGATRMTRRHGKVILCLASTLLVAAGATAGQPDTALERYAELIDLSGKGFSCLRATRPYGGVNARDQRMQDATGKIQRAIRAELVRREGAERVEDIERPPEGHHDPYLTSGPCNLTDADRAREL